MATLRLTTELYWEAKLARLADWDLPVVIFQQDEIVNRGELDDEIVALFG